MPYKFVFVAMHFIGAVVPLAVVWSLGDVALAIVIVPNLIALIMLSGQVRAMTKSYFERRPWIQNREDHLRAVAGRRTRD
jgi:AGCS family alanine or glycine:cation symporter